MLGLLIAVSAGALEEPILAVHVQRQECWQRFAVSINGHSRKDELVSYVEAVRPSRDPRQSARRPSNLLRLEGVTPPPLRRAPVIAWPGSTAR